jgi:hypothetical protein
MMKICSLLTLLALLIACQPPLETIEVTRVEATAVPTITSSPTALPLPTVTATKAALVAVTVTATPLPPTITPTATATPAVPTPTPAIPLGEFLTTLQDKLNARDFEALKDMMPPHFVLGRHASQRHNPAATNAVEFLAYAFVPWVEPEIVIREENILADLTAPFAVDTIFRGGQNITAVLPSSGWGQGGKGEVILYISIREGAYRWAGLLASQEYYIAPELELIAPPPGLIYKQDNDLWRVSQAGEPEYMTTFSGTLSFNPSGTLALYAATEDHQLTLLHLPEGDSEAIAIEGALLHGSWQMPWLDEETVVLIIGPRDEGVTQGSYGNLATLNVLNDTVYTFPPLLSLYTQPSAAMNGNILYDSQDGLHLRQGDDEQMLDFGRTLDFAGTEIEINSLYAPVMSPDGRYVVGVHSGEYGRYSWAYVLADLTTQTSRFIHFYIGAPTDAVILSGIHWSPDSQWLVLAPFSGDFFANSIQLVSVTNPGDSLTLPGVTNTPFWLDGRRLIFKRFVGDQSRWQYIDRMTGEQFWLDLPEGAEVVHYVSPN